MIDELKARVGDLERVLQVARGRVAQMREAVEDELAGVFQLEGRLMEAQEILKEQTDAEVASEK